MEGETMNESPPSLGSKLVSLLRKHPVVVGVFFLGTISGASLAVWLPIGPEDMSPIARVIGGALLGAWLAMFPLGFRLFD